jgi:hypothetical protein
MYWIHGHTYVVPSARQEYENLRERLRKHVAWVYTPMEGVKGLGFLGLFELAVSVLCLYRRLV